MEITIPKCCHLFTEPLQKRACISHCFPMAILIIFCFLVGSPYIINYKRLSSESGAGRTRLSLNTNLCKNHGKPSGCETLPEGIISRTSNLDFHPKSDSLNSFNSKVIKSSRSLLAIAVGKRQKKVVNDIVKKFYSINFTIMLFHYDGAVDDWRDLEWSNDIVHISAINQTKWWFAKRFLHPDIVAEYDYVFLWDEDLGVENFHPERYVLIVEKEGLEISQPALDLAKSQVHYQITARLRKGNVHRRTYKFSGGSRCYENSTGPPCTGWVEMMAPVFSRAAWRCVWHMIQNDLIHAWGLDAKLGYCAQGDRTKNVGVVDSEYIVHIGIPTLGGDDKSATEAGRGSSLLHASGSRIPVLPPQNGFNSRLAIRMRSHAEMEIFQHRWNKAVATDECWVDPYPTPNSNSTV